MPKAARTSSRYRSCEPSSMRARRSADSAGNPEFRRSAARSSTWHRNSSLRSCSHFWRRKIAAHVFRTWLNTRLRLPGTRLQRRRHCQHQPLPARGLRLQALSPGSGQTVELGPAIVVGGAPFRIEQALTFQTVQGWIERALFDIECAARDLLYAQKDTIAVLEA